MSFELKQPHAFCPRLLLNVSHEYVCFSGFTARQLNPEETPGFQRFAGLTGSKANASAAVKINVNASGSPSDFDKLTISKSIKDGLLNHVPGYVWCVP